MKGSARRPRGTAGWLAVLLGGLVLVSFAWPWLARLAFLPSCPVGLDPLFPYETVCAQTVSGLWRSLLLGLVGGAGACGVAVALAVAARSLGGVADLALEKLADLFFAIPDVLVLVSLGFAARAVRGGESVSLWWMAGCLVLVGWAAPTRMVQNRLRTLERLDFVLAARALGATRAHVVLRHLVPFAADYLLALFLLRVPAIILAESTISYLGFGLPLSEPSLGRYLGDHWRLLASEDWLTVLPAWSLLVLVIVAFHALGAALLAATQRSLT